MDYTVVSRGIIVDNSFSPPSEEDLAEFAANWGGVGNMRYTSEPLNNTKNLTIAQVRSGWKFGLGSLANQEQTHSDSQAGYDGGVRRARTHLACRRAIGMPDSIPAIVSHDTSWHAESLNFARGFQDTIVRESNIDQKGIYFFGPEPPEQLTNEGLCTDFFWQAFAGSLIGAESLADAHAEARRKYKGWDVEIRTPPGFTRSVEVINRKSHAYQRWGYVHLAGGPFDPGQCDENEVRRPIRVWLPDGIEPASGIVNAIPAPPVDPMPVPPTPNTTIPKENEMFQPIGDPRVFVWEAGGQIRHIESDEWGIRNAEGQVTAQVDPAWVASRPLYEGTARDTGSVIVTQLNEAIVGRSGEIMNKLQAIAGMFNGEPQPSVDPEALNRIADALVALAEELRH